MSGIVDQDLELGASFDELEAAVKKVRDCADISARKKALPNARKVYNATKNATNKFRNAVNRLDDEPNRYAYNKKFNEYSARIDKYDQELKNLVTAPKPGEKGGGSKAGGGASAGPKKLTQMEREDEEIMGEGGRDGLAYDTAGQMMDAAVRGQDAIIRTITKLVRLGYVMRDQAQEMLVAIQQQTEKLHKIDKELLELDGELDRAKADVKWFFRRIAGDKCCIGFMVLLLLGVIGLIFWKIYSNRFPNAIGSLGTATSSTTLLPGQTNAPPFSTTTNTPKPITFCFIC